MKKSDETKIKSRLIVVLGMHRSGTSLVTKGLQVMGVILGEQLLVEASDNEKGFWEDRDVLALNSEILGALSKLDWHSLVPAPIDKLSAKSLSLYRSRAITFLQEKMKGKSIFGIKDPRLCRLLPFWKDVFEFLELDVSYVISIRNPISVAHSLKKRDGFEFEKSYYLWLIHVVSSMVESMGNPRVIIDYDLLMEQPEEQLQQIAKILNLSFEESYLDEYINKYITDQMRHTQFHVDDLSSIPDLPDEIIEAYTLLNRVAKGQISISSKDVYDTFKKLELRIDALCPVFKYVEKKEIQIISSNREVGNRDTIIANLNREVGNRDTIIVDLNQEVGNRDTIIVDLNQEVGNRDTIIASLSEVVKGRDEQIQSMLSSTSWRITVPLRDIKTFFLRCMSVTSLKKRKQNPDSFFKRNIKRTHVALSLLSNFRSYSGGILPATYKVLRVLIREGWSGFVKRVLILQAQSGVSVDQARLHEAEAYKSYITAMEPQEKDLEAMAVSAASLAYRPKFSIVVPVYNVEAKWLTRFIESVLSQTYQDWELCIADDHSTLPHVKPLLESFAARDCRINLVFRDTNGHISAATNSALEFATGDFMCLMDNDDEIAPDALYEFASLLNRDKSIDMIYSDEDKIDIDGNRYEPFFKPDWSPEALEGCMYTAHFACYRMSLVRKIGGFRSEFNGAQDYDFVLRFTEHAKRIVHVPKILYHWRAIPGSTAESMNAKDYVLDSAIRALTERAERVSGGGEAKLGKYSGSFDLRYKIDGAPLVSIVIPSAGRMANIGGKDVDLLAQVVSSIYKNTSYRNFEIIIVDNNDLRPSTLNAIKPYNCHCIHFDGQFNIATKMNLGAREACGEYLLFMNDDIEIIAQDWMECMLQLCQREGVGAVGAKLLYENNTLQHTGVAFWDGLPDHIYRAYPGQYPGHFFSTVANRNYLAVTGAVLMTKRTLFNTVDGFDEQFAINYNDIDYCLKVFRKGFRIVYAAGAELFHYESVSREAVVAAEEIELFQQKWKDTVSYDPYYSDFFDNHPPVFSLCQKWESFSILDPVKSPVISHC